MYDTKIKNKIDNPALAQMAKLAMNSLTGKFGQKSYMDQALLTMDINNKITDIDEINKNLDQYTESLEHLTAVQSMRIINDEVIQVFYQKPINIAHKEVGNFIFLVSYITAAARAAITEFRYKAGVNNCYYCDTDSLVCNEQGYRNLEADID